MRKLSEVIYLEDVQDDKGWFSYIQGYFAKIGKKIEEKAVLDSRGLYEVVARQRDFNKKKSTLKDFDKTLAILNKKSCFGTNFSKIQEHKNFVDEAYHFLLIDVGLTSVLNVVAASKKIKIIYRDSVNFPTNNEILIGTQNMLNPARKYYAFGTIAHEMTRHAINLTYNNVGKPYFKGDSKRETEFSEIVKLSRKFKSEEKLIQSVFDTHKEDQWPAELIVRVPHMLALYHNHPDILAQKRNTFKPLFDYYEQNCVFDMEKYLPKFQSQFKSVKIIPKHKIIFGILSLLVALVYTFNIYYGLQFFIWNNLSVNQQKTVRDTNIGYLSCEVRFGDIFPENSNIHQRLRSTQVLGALIGGPFEFPKTVDEKMENFVYLNGSKLPKCLQVKLQTTKVNFQGQNLTMTELLSNNFFAFDFLESSQIVQILKGEKLFEVSKKIEQKSKFYIERAFLDEKCMKQRKILTGQICPRLNFSTIFDEIQFSRVFLFSTLAGEGKSTTFRHFGLKLKEKWPQKWVEFIDLKKNLKALEIGRKIEFETNEILVNFLDKTLLNLTDFESAVFKQKFQNGDMIFLWDGIDEVSPNFNEFMLELTSKFKDLTENWQFVSTRPEYSVEFQKKLKVPAFELAPLDEKQKDKFLMKFLTADQPEYSDKMDHNSVQILDKIKESDPNLSPILIEMAVEASKDQAITNEQKLNTFLLYENFVNEKFDISLEKGEIVMNELNLWIQEDILTFKKAHQPFAMKALSSLFEDGIDDANFVNDIRKYLNKKVDKVLDRKNKLEMSRFGILFVKSRDDFEFVHRTFTEFFAAKFLIANLLEDFEPYNEVESKVLIKFLSQVLILEDLKVVREFIMDYLESDYSNSKHFRTHNMRMKKLREITDNESITKFCRFVDFSIYFIKKFRISKELFQVSDLNADSYDVLMSNWDKIVGIFGEKSLRFGLENLDNQNLGQKW